MKKKQPEHWIVFREEVWKERINRSASEIVQKKPLFSLLSDKGQ